MRSCVRLGVSDRARASLNICRFPFNECDSMVHQLQGMTGSCIIVDIVVPTRQSHAASAASGSLSTTGIFRCVSMCAKIFLPSPPHLQTLQPYLLVERRGNLCKILLLLCLFFFFLFIFRACLQGAAFSNMTQTGTAAEVAALLKKRSLY